MLLKFNWYIAFLKCYTGLSVPKRGIFKFLVHTRAPSVFLFLIGKLQDVTCSCSKLFKKVIFLKGGTALSVSKTAISEKFGKKWDFTSIWKTKVVPTEAPLFLIFLIGNLHYLTSSSRKIIFKTTFLKLSHWIICSKNKNIRNISQKVSSLIHIKERCLFKQDFFLSFFS